MKWRILIIVTMILSGIGLMHYRNGTSLLFLCLIIFLLDISVARCYNSVRQVRKVRRYYAKRSFIMGEQGKYVWTTKMTSKGQIVIPKQAREVFDLKEGDTLILLGDVERGIAIAKYDDYLKFAEAIFKAKDGGGND